MYEDSIEKTGAVKQFLDWYSELHSFAIEMISICCFDNIVINGKRKGFR